MVAGATATLFVRTMVWVYLFCRELFSLMLGCGGIIGSVFIEIAKPSRRRTH
jgi:hypothetical protein